MRRIALVSREVHPFSGGGIAPIVSAAARLLTEIADVTVLTSATHRRRYDELRAERSPDLHPKVRFVFVEEPEPGQHAPWFSHMHAYSASVFEALCREFPDGGPDFVEFCDYLGEGFVTAQARHTFDPRLRNTQVCVRLHTTAELCNVLDGHMRDDFATIAVFDAERYVLRHADRILWSGGDVLGTYQRYYGDGLAEAEHIPDAFLEAVGHPPPEDEREPAADRPLRFLFLGRMERRKGVQNLIRAMLSLPPYDWSLTLLGGDTHTAPLQQSLKEQLGLMVHGVDKIRFAPPVPRADVGAFIREHDIVVVPSLWECWPNVVREALQQNRPVLATPVGGMVDMVRPGVSGWLTRDTSAEAIRQTVELLLSDPAEARRLREGGGPRQVFEELTDPRRLVRSYGRALERPSPRAVPRRRLSDPLVSIVVPYFRLDELVDDTLDSIAHQTYSNVETIIVNDGSLRDSDGILPALAERYGARLVTQANSGLGQARNMGVSQSRGRYILPLDADDRIAPDFVRRCVEVLESDRSLAYVTTWTKFMSPEGVPDEDPNVGYMPYGNWSSLIDRNNVGGTCTALIPRRLFDRFSYSPDLTSYEDWFLYRQFHAAGLHGAVIPERLFSYRVRADSMMRQVALPRVEMLMDEMRAHLAETSVQWTRPAVRGRQPE